MVYYKVECSRTQTSLLSFTRVRRVLNILVSGLPLQTSVVKSVFLRYSCSQLSSENMECNPRLKCEIEDVLDQDCTTQWFPLGMKPFHRWTMQRTEHFRGKMRQAYRLVIYGQRQLPAVPESDVDEKQFEPVNPARQPVNVAEGFECPDGQVTPKTMRLVYPMDSMEIDVRYQEVTSEGRPTEYWLIVPEDPNTSPLPECLFTIYMLPQAVDGEIPNTVDGLGLVLLQVTPKEPGDNNPQQLFVQQRRTQEGIAMVTDVVLTKSSLEVASTQDDLLWLWDNQSSFNGEFYNTFRPYGCRGNPPCFLCVPCDGGNARLSIAQDTEDLTGLKLKYFKFWSSS
ncbi:uncharacterized protein LOC135812176 [Sycon ciliatum]|uniref:uncharacterized protein LOC135812176 n=1 Tax=Sycon ciliatum TaxID=27933 RepID=UPI0031F6872D